MTDIHPGAVTEAHKPETAESLLSAMLRDNAAALTRCDTRLRQAREQVRGEESEMLRLTTIREGLQAARQAALRIQVAQPATRACRPPSDAPAPSPAKAPRG